jgi:predicted O-linked N-acetylglucosamine transferase (SPINDLY family)
MQETVDGYTRHYFTLAHYLVKNDKEAPPRTLFCKQKDLEKERANQVKQKPWKRAPLAVPFTNLFMLNPASMVAESYNKSCCGLSSVVDAQKNETDKQSKIEQNLQMQSQDISKPCTKVVQCLNNRPSSQNECCKKAKVDKAANEAHQVSFPTQLEEANKLPSYVNTKQGKAEKFGDEKIPIVLVSSYEG